MLILLLFFAYPNIIHFVVFASFLNRMITSVHFAMYTLNKSKTANLTTNCQPYIDVIGGVYSNIFECSCISSVNLSSKFG